MDNEKKKRGRPAVIDKAKFKSISIRIEIYEKIKRLAVARGVSVPAFVSDIALAHLENTPPEKGSTWEDF